jgi:magnesium and cobalt transporter
MNDDRTSGGSGGPGWLERLSQALLGEPRDRHQLVTLLRDAEQRHLLGPDVLAMIEGALQVSEMRVRDIMLPRPQTDVVERDAPLDQVLKTVVESGHSRFPVIGENRDEVVGILLAKDILPYLAPYGDGRVPLRELLRPAVFVPESKRLNVLLREFRTSRNHMAIVVDEYGGFSGLVTIEDVLEQIVGEIEDEYDFDEGAFILKRAANSYTIKAHTTIEEFNEYFGVQLDDRGVDTIGGLTVTAFGHLPSRGESVECGGFRFTVVRADSRRVRLLNVERLESAAGQAEARAAEVSPDNG